MFNKEDYREYMLINQYSLPSRLRFDAERHGDYLTYNQITMLYQTAVSEILKIYNKECLIDFPFGQGYLLAKNKWLQLLNEAIEHSHLYPKSPKVEWNSDKIYSWDVCPECSYEINRKDNFCSHCGQKIKH